jgi:hypothetical protein
MHLLGVGTLHGIPYKPLGIYGSIHPDIHVHTHTEVWLVRCWGDLRSGSGGKRQPKTHTAFAFQLSLFHSRGPTPCAGTCWMYVHKCASTSPKGRFATRPALQLVSQLYSQKRGSEMEGRSGFPCPTLDALYLSCLSHFMSDFVVISFLLLQFTVNLSYFMLAP